jgi:hypothetical protein
MCGYSCLSTEDLKWKKGSIMKPFVRIILFGSALFIGANVSMAAQAGATWEEQWFRVKFGRPSPAEEARRNAEQANIAFREEPAPKVRAKAPNWMEQHYRGKYGRSSPLEEARLKADQANVAFREETTPQAAPSVTNWIEQHYRGKYGRSSPMEETRRKTEGR